MAETFRCLNCHKEKPIYGRFAVLNKKGRITRYKCAECAARKTVYPVVK